MKNEKKVERPIYYKMKGVSLYGKYATVLLTDTAMEVHTTPSWLFLLTAWMFAMVGFFIGAMFNGMIIIMTLSIGLGMTGALLVWNLYVGKLSERYAYNDVASFTVSGSSELSINMKNHKMYALRMLPRKQEALMNALQQVMHENTNFVLKQETDYYRVYSKREQEAQK